MRPKMINFAHKLLQSEYITKPSSNFALGYSGLLVKIIVIIFYLILTF